MSSCPTAGSNMALGNVEPQHHFGWTYYLVNNASGNEESKYQ